MSDVERQNAEAVLKWTQNSAKKLNHALEEVRELKNAVSTAMARMSKLERAMVLLQANSIGSGPTDGDHG